LASAAEAEESIAAARGSLHHRVATPCGSLFRAAREDEDRLEALYVLAVTTGMRQGELLGLKWEDVDLEREVLQVRRTLVKNGGKLGLGEPKTKKSRRTVHLTGRAVGALKQHRKAQAEERLALPGLWQNTASRSPPRPAP
jgi:integrase